MQAPGCLQCLHCCCCFPFWLDGIVHQITFPAPDRNLEELESEIIAKRELIWLNISPRRKTPRPIDLIPALHVKSPSGHADFTVLYSHGNAEDIAVEQYFVRELSQRFNCDFLVYEYPGYSLSKYTAGKTGDTVHPSEHKTQLAVEAAYRYLVNDCNLEPAKIILYGRSIGSGPTLHIASRYHVYGTKLASSPQNVAGVFLVSPFLSTLRAVFGHKLARCCFCYDMFPNHRNIHHVSAPVAILHARDDDVVKFYNGETLADCVKNKVFEPKWLDRGDHNNIDLEEIYDYFLKFKDCVKARPNLNFIPKRRFKAEGINAKFPQPVLLEFFEHGTVGKKIKPPLTNSEIREKRVANLNNRKRLAESTDTY